MKLYLLNWERTIFCKNKIDANRKQEANEKALNGLDRNFDTQADIENLVKGRWKLLEDKITECIIHKL